MDNSFTEGLRIISHDLPLSAFRLLYSKLDRRALL